MRESTWRAIDAALAQYVVNEVPLKDGCETIEILGRMLADYLDGSGQHIVDVAARALSESGWAHFGERMRREFSDTIDQIAEAEA